MNDDDLDQRLEAYGSRWRDAHPFGNDVDTSSLHRRSGAKTLTAIVAAAAVVVAAVGVAAAVRNGGSSDTHPVSPPRTTLATPKATTTTTSPSPATSIPLPQPTEQVTVLANQPPEPIAVGNEVWIGTDTGVNTFDPVTLRRVGHLPTKLPVLAIATSPDGLWVISGKNEDIPYNDNPPYRLERIDPVTLRVEFSTELPFAVGWRSFQQLRLVAEPGVAWVSQDTTVLRIDAHTDKLTSISLSGSDAGNIAADNTGLWVSCNFGDGSSLIRPLLHIDAQTNAVTVIPGIPTGFYWSIATTGDAAWLLAGTGNGPGLALVRIDAPTHAVKTYRLPGIALVAGDGQLWTQITVGNSLNYNDLVAQIDTTAGRITRTIKIAIGEVPGSAGSGYSSPPFAIANGQIWSAYSGIQRTTLRR